MKKKKQQHDIEDLEPPEGKERETSAQLPSSPVSNKSMSAPQPMKRGQKVEWMKLQNWLDLPNEKGPLKDTLHMFNFF